MHWLVRIGLPPVLVLLSSTRLDCLAAPAVVVSPRSAGLTVAAACSAAGSNLTEVFAERWRWPLSTAAKEEARSRFGKPIEPL
jgi:hypothetical protein